MPRPKGLLKTGGRKKGSKNKLPIAVQADIRRDAPVKPLEYMLNVLADPDADQGRKDDMAKAAAPYVHPRLQATQIQEVPAPVTPATLANNLDLARRIAYALRQGQIAKKAQQP
jgi:hypothetical protein